MEDAGWKNGELVQTLEAEAGTAALVVKLPVCCVDGWAAYAWLPAGPWPEDVP